MAGGERGGADDGCMAELVTDRGKGEEGGLFPVVTIYVVQRQAGIVLIRGVTHLIMRMCCSSSKVRYRGATPPPPNGVLAKLESQVKRQIRFRY